VLLRAVSVSLQQTGNICLRHVSLAHKWATDTRLPSCMPTPSSLWHMRQGDGSTRSLETPPLHTVYICDDGSRSLGAYTCLPRRTPSCSLAARLRHLQRSRAVSHSTHMGVLVSGPTPAAHAVQRYTCHLYCRCGFCMRSWCSLRTPGPGRLQTGAAVAVGREMAGAQVAGTEGQHAPAEAQTWRPFYCSLEAPAAKNGSNLFNAHVGSGFWPKPCSACCSTLHLSPLLQVRLLHALLV
jgi:hypothetical protein